MCGRVGGQERLVEIKGLHLVPRLGDPVEVPGAGDPAASGGYSMASYGAQNIG